MRHAHSPILYYETDGSQAQNTTQLGVVEWCPISCPSQRDRYRPAGIDLPVVCRQPTGGFLGRTERDHQDGKHINTAGTGDGD